jgi:hypothetical protein
MAGKTDKYKNVVIAFYSGKKGITQKITKRKNVLQLDTINVSDLYLLLSLLWDRTWYFCRVAVAYVVTSVDVYPEVASGFPEVYLLLFLWFPSPQSQAFPRLTVMATVAEIVTLRTALQLVRLQRQHRYGSVLDQTSRGRPQVVAQALEARREMLLPILRTKSDSVHVGCSLGGSWFQEGRLVASSTQRGK